MISEYSKTKNDTKNWRERFADHELFNVQIMNAEQAIRNGAKSAAANSKMTKQAKSLSALNPG